PFDRRRRVVSEKPITRIAYPSDRAHELGVSLVSHPCEPVAIDERGAQESPKPGLPGAIIGFRRQREQSARREMAREHSDADSEAPERTLKASRLACEENAALTGRFRHQYVPRAAESHRVSHREASAFAEELDGPFEIDPLAVKILEEAGRHRAPTGGNQEVCVALRSQKIGKHSEGSIGAARLEGGSDCDRVGGSGAAGDDATFRQPRPGLTEADLDASGEGLALQRLVESAGARAPRDEIKKRLARPVAVLASLRIEKSPFPNGTG